eukprot:3940369-Rhodomonas_salina.1
MSRGFLAVIGKSILFCTTTSPLLPLGDLLYSVSHGVVDFYLPSPGGSGWGLAGLQRCRNSCELPESLSDSEALRLLLSVS